MLTATDLTGIGRTASEDEGDEDALAVLAAHDVEAKAGLALHQHHVARLSATRIDRYYN